MRPLGEVGEIVDAGLPLREGIESARMRPFSSATRGLDDDLGIGGPRSLGNAAMISGVAAATSSQGWRAAPGWPCGVPNPLFRNSFNSLRVHLGAPLHVVEGGRSPGK